MIDLMALTNLANIAGGYHLDVSSSIRKMDRF